jgi:X-X-X-Leu-X-X-Gly heptad repeat protein
MIDRTRVWKLPLPTLYSSIKENLSMAKKKPTGCPTRAAIDEIVARLDVVDSRLALSAKFEELRTAERMLHTLAQGVGTLAQGVGTLTERVEAIEATLAAEDLAEDDEPVTRTWQQWWEGR